MDAKPAFLNFKQLCAVFGVSERKGHQLRAEPWFPKPFEFGPRCLKWAQDEAVEAAKRCAPRKADRAEPQQLAAARVERQAA